MDGQWGNIDLLAWLKLTISWSGGSNVPDFVVHFHGVSGRKCTLSLSVERKKHMNTAKVTCGGNLLLWKGCAAAQAFITMQKYCFLIGWDWLHQCWLVFKEFLHRDEGYFVPYSKEEVMFLIRLFESGSPALNVGHTFWWQSGWAQKDILLFVCWPSHLLASVYSAAVVSNKSNSVRIQCRLKMDWQLSRNRQDSCARLGTAEPSSLMGWTNGI